MFEIFLETLFFCIHCQENGDKRFVIAILLRVFCNLVKLNSMIEQIILAAVVS